MARCAESIGDRSPVWIGPAELLDRQTGAAGTVDRVADHGCTVPSDDADDPESPAERGIGRHDAKRLSAEEVRISDRGLHRGRCQADGNRLLNNGHHGEAPRVMSHWLGWGKLEKQQQNLSYSSFLLLSKIVGNCRTSPLRLLNISTVSFTHTLS